MGDINENNLLLIFSNLFFQSKEKHTVQRDAHMQIDIYRF